MGARTGRLRSVSGAALGVTRARSVGGPWAPTFPTGSETGRPGAVASRPGYPTRSTGGKVGAGEAAPTAGLPSMFVGPFARWPALSLFVLYSEGACEGGYGGREWSSAMGGTCRPLARG